ncbi:putative vacuolar ATP synthase subunit C [Cardiosporidium cionae]|uniref:V-type proton ATPase subunit C n=1 Tax=Cardiosporidium cionae TaxID=476202 RepID=A0ABQ7J926_9APIC|nr:putative vacuolar ATP synthase subunit C [Cardiosporidium cionae]|eukprot:KAF8820165.1 putative vacuolar ATP synthase subunit C [Cardiosporidium cionae]
MALPYVLIGAPLGNSNREAIYSNLKLRTLSNSLCKELSIFEVPLNLKFGSFDDLIRAVDEFPKHDSAVENILRKVQRQAIDINPNQDFKIILQGKSIPIEQYMRRYTWDDSKFPRTRALRDNLQYLLQTVIKSDDNVRIKAAGWMEAKAKSSDLSKNENVSFSQRDLVDVLTPTVVKNDDFIETEHLSTVIVYIPRGLENEWMNVYETLQEFVVPRSAKRFNLKEKEGGSLWRVIVFKSAIEAFTTNARDHRFVVREFVYRPGGYDSLIQHRTKIEAEKSQQEGFLSRLCAAAFSEVFTSWMHLKAMRMFCESVLRYGVPPRFASFLLKPASDGKMKRLRKELGVIFKSDGLQDLYTKAGKSNDIDSTVAPEEFFPYVNLTLLPLA